MRLVGPNSMGIVNSAPEVSLTGTFARADVPAGTVGFVSQSGAFGAAAIDGMSRRGIGLSAFVSLGDKADLSSNDVLQYWEQDPATQVVALYLESFGNPRKFGRVARRVARAKPVLAVKAGRTSAGARAASSHTGALIAASDDTVDALFASAGVIRCESLDDLLDAAAVLAEQPVPGGERRRDRLQRPRAGRRLRRRLRGRGPGRREPVRGHPGARCARSSRRRRSSPARCSSSRPSPRRASAPRSSTSPPTPRWTR